VDASLHVQPRERGLKIGNEEVCGRHLPPCSQFDDRNGFLRAGPIGIIINNTVLGVVNDAIITVVRLRALPESACLHPVIGFAGTLEDGICQENRVILLVIIRNDIDTGLVGPRAKNEPVDTCSTRESVATGPPRKKVVATAAIDPVIAAFTPEAVPAIVSIYSIVTFGPERIFVLLVFNSNDGHLKSSTENASPKFANFDAPLCLNLSFYHRLRNIIIFTRLNRMCVLAQC
jgi:hypothetical protein